MVSALAILEKATMLAIGSKTKPRRDFLKFIIWFYRIDKKWIFVDTLYKEIIPESIEKIYPHNSTRWLALLKRW